MHRRIVKYIDTGKGPIQQEVKPSFQHPETGPEGTYYQIRLGDRDKLVTFRDAPGVSMLGADSVSQMLRDPNNKGRSLYFVQMGDDEFRHVVPVEPPMGGFEAGALNAMAAERVKINREDPLAKRLVRYINDAEYPQIRREIAEMPLGQVVRFSSLIGIFYESDMGDRILRGIKEEKTWDQLFGDLRRWDGYSLVRLGEVVPERVSDRPLRWGSMPPLVRGVLSRHGYDLIALPGVAEVGTHSDLYTSKKSLDESLFLGKTEGEVERNIPISATLLKENFRDRAKLAGSSNPIDEAENLMLASSYSPFQLAERYGHKWLKLNALAKELTSPTEVLHGVSDVSEFLVVHRWNPLLPEGYEVAINRRWIFSDSNNCLATKTPLVKAVAELNEGFNQVEAAGAGEKDALIAENSGKLQGNLAGLRAALLRDAKSHEIEIQGKSGLPEHDPYLRQLRVFDDNAHFLVNGLGPLVRHPREAFLLFGAWREKRLLGL